jgi:hypothetical protein
MGSGANQADLGYSGGRLAEATPFPASPWELLAIAWRRLHRHRAVCLRVTAALFPAGSQFNNGS